MRSAERALARARQRSNLALLLAVGVALSAGLALVSLHYKMHTRNAAVAQVTALAARVEAGLLRATDELSRLAHDPASLAPAARHEAIARSRTRLSDLMESAPRADEANVAGRAGELSEVVAAVRENARHALILSGLGHAELVLPTLDTARARADRILLRSKAGDYVRAAASFAANETVRLRRLQTMLEALLGMAMVLALALIVAFSFRRSGREAREAGHALARMAETCSLTGLCDRRGFDTMLARRVAEGQPFALVLVDLNEFKPINDRFGHAAGDAVLREVGERMRAFFGGDTRQAPVARLAGDEFAALISAGRSEDAAERSRRALAVASDLRSAVTARHKIGSGSLRVDASVGVACFPEHVPDDAPEGHEASEEDAAGSTGALYARTDALHHAAGMALGRAKAEPGSIRLYDPAMDDERRANDALRAEVTRACEAGEFVPFVQPVVDLEDGRIVSFEMLARWQRGDRVVGPAMFLDAITSAGLLDRLMLDLLAVLLPEVARWPDEVSVSVNLSMAQIQDPNFVAAFCEAVEGAGIDGNRIEVELLEEGALSDRQAAAMGLAALRASGMHVALDDFGMGYSNFSRLDGASLDKLKIDRVFVMGMATNATYRSVVRAALDIARSLGVPTVAEGIEDKASARVLREMGCSLGQGFHFARPMSMDEARALIEERDAGARLDRLAL